MTRTALRHWPGTGVEMTSDVAFAGRVRRLSAVSSVALGVISLLAITTTDVGSGVVGLLATGWITMPAVLVASLRHPRLRYLLTVPSSLVSLGLLVTAVTYDGPVLAALGWWLMTAGVLLGGALGGWFWFRLAPVPARLDQPFSRARWSLVTIHVALIAGGAASVTAAAVL